MTNEDLVRLYQEGNKEVLIDIIEQNRGIVNKIVNHYYIEKTSSIDREDLLQEGYIGLIIATGRYKFNAENPCKFITYAIYWVAQRISRFIRTKNTSDETSLNAPVGVDGEGQLQDLIECKNNDYEKIEEKIYQQELRAELESVMDEANTLREREILKFHYGWDSNKEMIFDDISELFNVTPGRVRQIEAQALRKIRNTKWGRLKIREKYGDIKSNQRNTEDVLNKIEYEEKLLYFFKGEGKF